MNSLNSGISLKIDTWGYQGCFNYLNSQIAITLEKIICDTLTYGAVSSKLSALPQEDLSTRCHCFTEETKKYKLRSPQACKDEDKKYQTPSFEYLLF